jgi:hypothetical protein
VAIVEQCWAVLLRQSHLSSRSSWANGAASEGYPAAIAGPFLMDVAKTAEKLRSVVLLSSWGSVADRYVVRGEDQRRMHPAESPTGQGKRSRVPSFYVCKSRQQGSTA